MPFLVALSGIISGVRDHSMTVRLDQQTRQRLQDIVKGGYRSECGDRRRHQQALGGATR